MAIMMPFVTWGISSVNSKNTADGTALLTALRTIAGAIGTAVAVGVMNCIAEKDGSPASAASQIHGMHISFAVMSVIALIMFIVVLFFVKSPNRNTTKTNVIKNKE